VNVKLLITIDTEEDNWSRYSSTCNPVENIERLVPLQELFDRYGVKPTYLVSYPVATNPRSVDILKTILDQGKCEIGSHCHPWNTPPFEEEINNSNTMLCNLPEESQYRKIKNLHDAIIRNFDVAPVSFRAGRWGFSPVVARSLLRLGYRVDTSVTPYLDWAMCQGPDFSAYDSWPFRFSADELSAKSDGELLQIPVSVGFLQSNFEFYHRLSRRIDNGIFRKIHLHGILRRLRLLNKVWLSPEHADKDSMVQLAKRMKQMNFPCLNMSFHSTSLLAGLSPFVETSEDEKDFCLKIESLLRYADANCWEFVTLSQYETGHAVDDL
jgi:hypothetical protein